MDNQLQEIIELQKQQNQLLKKHLTRIRFSLWALLVLMTLTGVGLGLGVYLTRPRTAAIARFPRATASSKPYTLSISSATDLPTAPPSAVYSDPAMLNLYEPKYTPNGLPSVNVSEIIK
jgi:hypothetical protein